MDLAKRELLLYRIFSGFVRFRVHNTVYIFKSPTDEDRYLESITERQDININMTKMSNEEIMGAIKEGASKLNEMLDLGLNEDTYIRTKGYKNRLDNLEKQRPKIDPKKIKRNVNDMSFNYAQTDFKFEEQPNT